MTQHYLNFNTDGAGDEAASNWCIWRDVPGTTKRRYLLAWDGTASTAEPEKPDADDLCDLALPITDHELAQLLMLARTSGTPENWAKRARNWAVARWATRQVEGELPCPTAP